MKTIAFIRYKDEVCKKEQSNLTLHAIAASWKALSAGMMSVCRSTATESFAAMNAKDVFVWAAARVA